MECICCAAGSHPGDVIKLPALPQFIVKQKYRIDFIDYTPDADLIFILYLQFSSLVGWLVEWLASWLVGCNKLQISTIELVESGRIY